MPNCCRLVLLLATCLGGPATRGFGQNQPTAPPPARPAPALLDLMDGPDRVLRLRNPSTLVRLVDQTIVHDPQRAHAGAERIVVSCPPGQSAHVAYALPPAPVTDALRCTVTLRCSRPGLRLASIVSLPRTLSPSTGRPLDLLVAGPQTSRGERWERLSLQNLPVELRRMARVATAQQGVAVDIREAVVRQLVFLTPGGAGPTELIVDQIEVFGPMPLQKQAGDGLLDKLRTAPARAAETTAAAPLRAPGIPRILQWQGEDFALLRKLGFDAASLSMPPTAEQLEQARRSGLRLVCPAPPAPRGNSDETPLARGVRDLDVVLAWDLGGFSSEPERAYARSSQALLDRSRTLPARPTIAWGNDDVRGASRIADICVLYRRLAGSSLSPRDYAGWLSRQTRLARPGTSFWVAIDTHLGLQQGAQLAALDGSHGDVVAVPLAEALLSASATLPARPQGFLFKSQRSLAAADAESRRRAIAAELVNQRLELLEPWLLSGKPTGTARTSHPDLSALVLKAERSHLLVPLDWRQPQRENPPGPIAVISPGASEAADAYLLTLGGAQRLRTARVTGGVRVTVDDLPADAVVLMTEDGLAFSRIDRRLRRFAPRAAELYLELVDLELRDASEAMARLSAEVRDKAEAEPNYRAATLLRAECAARRQAGDALAACSSGQRAVARLNNLRRRLELVAVGEDPAGSWPLASSWSALPTLETVTRTARGASPRPLALPGGEFENLAQLLQSGWRHLQHPSAGVKTAVRLSPESPREGKLCLQLEATASDPDSPLPTLSSPPVWITSPPLPPGDGKLIEISGWVRAAEPVVGSPGELLIFDSLGGEATALRVRHAPQWQRFRMIRAATPGAPMQLTFALAGLGKVEIDALQLRTISR